MNPAIAYLDTVLADVRLGLGDRDLVEVRALLGHGIFSFLSEPQLYSIELEFAQKVFCLRQYVVVARRAKTTYAGEEALLGILPLIQHCIFHPLAR